MCQCHSVMWTYQLPQSLACCWDRQTALWELGWWSTVASHSYSSSWWTLDLLGPHWLKWSAGKKQEVGCVVYHQISGHNKDLVLNDKVLCLPCSPGCHKTGAADSQWWWPGTWGYSFSAREPSSAGRQQDAPPSWPPLGVGAGCGGWWWHKIRLIPLVNCTR